jgi:glycosyltransferase involved in cell wall biosynthesis
MNLLVLAPETPVPPISGSRLRTLHLARELAKAFDVTMAVLGSAPLNANEPFDLVGIPHEGSRAKALVRSFGGRPYLAAKLHSAAAARFARNGQWHAVQAELPYTVPAALNAGRPVVLNTQNVETQILHALATTERAALRRVRWRWEAAKTERFERETVRAAAAVCAVSEDDAEALERLGARRVVVVDNGVDTAARTYREPTSNPLLVYIGHFGYRPNALAARELVNEILPAVRAELPRAALRLVGRAPDAWLERPRPNVEVAGEVDDVLPHFHAAGVFIVPLRAGGGTRIKILEAMAAGAPVVATPVAVAGLDVRDGEHVLLGTSPAELSALAARVLTDRSLALGLTAAARKLVETRYDWSVVARPLVEIYDRLGAT